ncbi:uncharacterized protein LOC132735360 [Ruditapes philippinarum]|uniref:uncharacterized protein LOC132735360 n=1 Tax=Ruditapes philippinarum TaxID=129788 RepID=UPI00295B3722|nr:uncharacterized protein LOC132735360 [Ruditapes philippinarum]
METKIQIIVATVIGIVGIIVGVSLILFAVLYRRKLVKKSNGFAVTYRKRNRNSGADDRVSINIGQRHIINYDEFSLASKSRCSRPASWKSQSEVQLRPKLHQAVWNHRSSRIGEHMSTTRKISQGHNGHKIHEDFSERRKSSSRSLSYSPSACAGQELETVLRHHSDTVEMRQIPRPNVRPYKNELYENIESVYDHIKL